MALVELPHNYELIECQTHNVTDVVMLMRPVIPEEKHTLVGTISVEGLHFNDVCFEKRSSEKGNFIVNVVKEVQARAKVPLRTYLRKHL